jgi:RNA polymerase sigma-70 factor (ECF subfamily)
MPDTRESLLIRIRDRDDSAAWHEFVNIYAPLIHAYAMRRGLQDADAADVAQQVLGSIARVASGFEYDRSKGAFRGWLFTVTRNQIRHHVARSQRNPTATGDTTFHQMLNEQPATTEEEETWNQQHQQQLFQWAMEKAKVDFREVTWEAFRRVAINGEKAPDVAASLGISVGAVYIAKSRVMAKIRELVVAAETS